MLEIYILDKDTFDVVGIVDTYESLIWTERFNDCGDFELIVPISLDAIELLTTDRFLYINTSKCLMVIETVEIVTDVENGITLTINGRSIESILDRRVVLKQTTINGNAQDGLKRIFDENLISPSEADRKISSVIFKSSNDTRITSLEIDAQFHGDDLLSVTKAICEVLDIGFKMELTEDEKLEFSLYHGEDRSYDQETNPYVVFSPSFDNLMNSTYMQSDMTYKNFALILGEGEGSSRISQNYAIGTPTGFDRREMYVDASDISRTGDSTTLTKSQYKELLKERGMEELANNTKISSFEGEADTENMYVYGKDFFIGDIVQIENEFGMTAKSRIVELVRSYSPSGIEVYPTFSQI